MIVVMNPCSCRDHVDHVVRLLDGMGIKSNVLEGAARSVVELLEVNGRFDRRLLERAPMVDQVLDRPAPILAADRSGGEGRTETCAVPLGSRFPTIR